MLGCDEFVGCFGSCDEIIDTGIKADFDGDFTYETVFVSVLHKSKGTAVLGENIKLKNTFTPGMFHKIKITHGITEIKIGLKITTQCL